MLSIRLVYRCRIYAQRNYCCFSETFLYKSLIGGKLKKMKQETKKVISTLHLILVEIRTIFNLIYI